MFSLLVTGVPVKPHLDLQDNGQLQRDTVAIVSRFLNTRSLLVLTYANASTQLPTE